MNALAGAIPGAAGVTLDMPGTPEKHDVMREAVTEAIGELPLKGLTRPGTISQVLALK